MGIVQMRNSETSVACRGDVRSEQRSLEGNHARYTMVHHKAPRSIDGSPSGTRHADKVARR